MMQYNNQSQFEFFCRLCPDFFYYAPLCLYALASYNAQNYASIIRQGLALNYALSTILHHMYITTTHSSAMSCPTHHWCLPETSSSLPLPIVRFLASWYTMQKMQVHWDKSLSEPFSVSNGVHQGSVMLPHLFTVYIDSLLFRFV